MQDFRKALLEHVPTVSSWDDLSTLDDDDLSTLSNNTTLSEMADELASLHEMVEGFSLDSASTSASTSAIPEIAASTTS
jgi:hypothetical protein